MGRMRGYVELVRQSRLLAPNLRELTLRLFTGEQHRGNRVARLVVRDHLLALRWMNPNAVVFLREVRGQGAPSVEFELWKDAGTAFGPRREAGASAASAVLPSGNGGARAGAGPPAPAPSRRLRRFEVTLELRPEEVVAKVLMAARDPEDDDMPAALTAAVAGSAGAVSNAQT